MKHITYRKGVALAVILLFVSVSVIPSTGTNVVEKSSTMSFEGNTLYVGGSGEGNYTRIQDAIDNASNGDTVFVYNDSSPYYENVVIDKTINLIGEDKDTTIIDGGGKASIVKITANGVTLSRFTIQEYAIGGWSVYCSGDDCVISFNKICDEGRCIGVRASNVQIYGNELTSTSSSALEFRGCTNIDVFRNNITHCDNPYDLFLNKKIKIHENNFIGNVVRNGYWAEMFLTSISPLSKTRFYRNYWYRPRVFPKAIIGTGFIWYDGIPFPIPIVHFDLLPAKEPYDIGVG